MRKFKNLVIGGIESKIVNLILIAIILLTVGSAGISVTRDHLLTRLSQETNARQQQAITEVTEGVLDSVVRTNMQQVTGRDARLTDDMFKDLKTRVVMMGDYAQKLFEHPEDYPLHSFAEPDAALDGQLSAQVLYAPGVDKAALSERLGLLANLSELMLALCDAFGAENVFVAVPEGAVLIANNISASWVGEDGEPIPFNPLGSYWYDQAVEAGELVFSDIQTDTATGEICVTCVMPIYARGELQAVVGADLFLDVMESTAKKTSYDGGMLVVVNQNGHAVVSSFDEGLLAVRPSGEAADLRESENEVLAALTRDALEGSTDVRLLTLDGKEYYAMGSPVSTVGWTLITMYDKSKLDAPIETLQQNYDAIASETAADYLEKNASYRNWGIAILLLFVVLLGGAAIMLGKRIVRPLNTMIERIAELDAEKPQFMMEDVYRTKDEIEALAESFAELSKQTVNYVSEVQRVTAEKERISTELQMANQIQESMLPSLFPAFPDRKEFDIYATMEPAKEVGGDFYDFFLIDDDHLCMVMADVSGKGVPAALFMMASKIIIHNYAMVLNSSAEILARTNEALCSNNKMEMFVTVWLGILEISTGKVSCANAGHEYPALKHGEQFELLKDKHGFVLGGMNGLRYKEYSIQLSPGDKLFLYTDGVPEATDNEEELFGTDRMIEALNKGAAGTPVDVLHSVHGAVDAFVGTAQQFDDLTMLCLEYRGK